jgi:hypothetical protein
MSEKVLVEITEPKAIFDGATTKYNFRKADLKPGEKKYYEITAVQVDAAFIEKNGDRIVTKEQPQGQVVAAGDWVLTQTDADGKSQQWTMWDASHEMAKSGQGAYFQQRWNAVAGKDGYFSPRSVPTPMVELPEGGKLKVSWGEVQGGAGSFLAKYGEGDYNIITREDLVKLGYTGMDDVSIAKLEDIAA